MLNNTMEDYRNEVVNYYATQSQITSKFTSKTNQKTPLGYMGAMGGPTPCGASSRVFPAQLCPLGRKHRSTQSYHRIWRPCCCTRPLPTVSKGLFGRILTDSLPIYYRFFRTFLRAYYRAYYQVQSPPRWPPYRGSL